MDITWTDCLINEEVLHRVNEEWNIPHTVSRKKANGLVKSCVGTEK